MKKKQFYYIKTTDDMYGTRFFFQRYKTLTEARKHIRNFLLSKKVSKVSIVKVIQTSEEVEEVENPNYEGSNND